MRTQIIIALISALAGFFGNFLLIVFTPVGKNIADNYISPKIFEPISQGRREAISGLWTGLITQKFKNKPVSYKGELELKVEGRKLVGELRIPPADDPTQNKRIRFDVSGGFLYDRFARLEYQSTDKDSIYFGSIIVELNQSGKELKGNFIASGVYSGALVNGSVVATKSP